MKAWEVSDNRLILDNVEPPVASEGESILDVAFAGVCGSDLPKLLAPSTFDLPTRWRPGHEIVGVDPAGTVVAVDPLIPCDACVHCNNGDTHLCGALARIGWDRPGGFAHQVLVPNGNIHPTGDIPALVAVLADPMAVAVHGLRCSGLGHAKSIAVIGAGAIGLLTAVYARSLGKDVTLIARRSPRPQLDGVRLTTVDDVDRRAFDVVVDAASGASAEPLALALDLVRDGGTVLVQNAYHPSVSFPGSPRDMFRRSLRLVGSFSFCRRDGHDFIIGIDVLRQTPDVSAMLEVSGPLDELSQLLKTNQRPRTLRHVLAIP
jgi:threonine dehydrogenase-like Zn-dependent dehydrogenase